MITPDGTDPRPRPTRPLGITFLVIAALVVVAGLILIGTLTSPNPAALEETTTTTPEEVEPPIDPENFTVDQIATGEPLDWDLAMAIDDGYPLELLAHEGDVYLFTGLEHAGGPDSAGLVAWRSSNGTDWEALGEVISAEHRIVTVDSTVQGLVATSVRGEDGALVLWESADAAGWAPTEVPTRTEGPYHVVVASAVGANEATLLVASNTRYDRERLLEDRRSAWGIELELSDLPWNLRWLGAEGQHLFVTGPLGVPLLEIPIDALELSDEQRQELISELFDPVGSDIWVRGGSGEWGAGSIGDARVIDSILPISDGRFAAHGRGVASRVSKITADGIDWAPAVSTFSPRMAQPWRQRFVGVIDTPELVVSEDGESWEAVGLDERFPEELPWSPIALGAGDGGVAVFVRGDRLRSLGRPDPLELTADDGSRFLLIRRGGDFVLSSDGGRGRWVMNADQASVDVDVAGRRVTLSDPETGEDRASFSLTRLRWAELGYMRNLVDSAGFWDVMAFTGDGGEWIIQDMAPQIGDHATIWLLAVTDDRVVAVVRDIFDALIHSGAPGLEIWSAPLP